MIIVCATDSQRFRHFCERVAIPRLKPNTTTFLNTEDFRATHGRNYRPGDYVVLYDNAREGRNWPEVEIVLRSSGFGAIPWQEVTDAPGRRRAAQQMQNQELIERLAETGSIRREQVRSVLGMPVHEPGREPDPMLERLLDEEEERLADEGLDRIAEERLRRNRRRRI